MKLATRVRRAAGRSVSDRPNGQGPFAAVLFGHWGNGTRAEFISRSENLRQSWRGLAYPRLPLGPSATVAQDS